MILLLKFWREILLLIAVTVIYFFAFYVQKLQNESEIDKHNIKALTTNLKIVVGQHGEKIAEVNGLQYTLSEFKEREVDLAQTIKSMKLKQKNVISVTKIGTSSEIKIKVPLKTNEPTKKLPPFCSDSMKYFAYSDKYNRINGCVIRDSVELMAFYTDTLVIVPNIIPKHTFMWWSWGTKGIKLDAFLSNPNSSIIFAKYIEIK